MSLTKASGNMYNWLSHMHTHLGGECPHRCSYCYVKRGRAGNSPKYKGEFRLIEPELDVNYGSDKRIFIEHMNDLFAWANTNENEMHWNRIAILQHCQRYPENQYVFQTKNPEKALKYMQYFPPNFLFGTTIETNDSDLLTGKTQAPDPYDRFMAMLEWAYAHKDKNFVTIEPVMTFSTPILGGWIKGIDPLFVNIGADSKNSGLTEPDPVVLNGLIAFLTKANLDVRIKDNLQRLVKKGA